LLPPLPLSSPPPKPNIEEKIENYDNDETKETTLIELNEHGSKRTDDTKSYENSKRRQQGGIPPDTKSNESSKRQHITVKDRNIKGKTSIQLMRGIKEHPFIRTIREVLHNQGRRIVAPPIQFEFTQRAATRNWEIISEAGGLDALIRNSPFSPISYGSEFKESSKLAPLLHDHPLWPRFRSILDNGSIFPLSDPPPCETRLKDFDAILAYKNHRSAINNMDILNDHLTKEVQKGWLIPLHPEDARKLENASVAPMGVVQQSTINELGEIIPSNRVTHDLSFPGPISGSSINSRTQMEKLEPCYYGHMLNRLIHQIVAYREKYPSLPIVLQKVDFKSAYRRMHVNATTATQCLAQTCIDGNVYVLLPLRLSFGGSACPAEWCIASEITTDLANRILNHNHWTPQTLRATQSDLIPPTELLDPSIPFGQAKKMIVNPKTEEVGKSDVYVDNICLVGILKDEFAECRLKNSVLLALEIVGRPIEKNEPLPCTLWQRLGIRTVNPVHSPDREPDRTFGPEWTELEQVRSTSVQYLILACPVETTYVDFLHACILNKNIIIYKSISFNL
jgi:hypothetical protein